MCQAVVKADKMKKVKKEKEFPHTFVVIFILIIIAAVLTYIIPAGVYERVKDPATGRMIVDPATYHLVEKNPTKLFGIVESIPKGLIEAGWNVFLVIIIGGSFTVVEKTGAIKALLGKVLGGINEQNTFRVLPFIMFTFACVPAFTGNSECLLAFVPLGITIARSLGFDALTGIAIVTVSGTSGFASGLFNALTVGTAQRMIGLPLFSGLWFRVIGFALFFGSVCFWTMWYARRVRSDMKNSYCYNVELTNSSIESEEMPELTKKNLIIIGVVICGIAGLIYSAINGYEVKTTYPSIFMIVGMAAGLVSGMNANGIAKEFVVGAKTVLVGALVVGFARGISVILADAHIIDSIVYGLSSVLVVFPKTIGAVFMYICQLIINCFIISGSGQAAATIPIMSPLGDVLGVTQQTVVMAFTYGDGLTNIILPMSASLMGALAIGNVEYPQFIKFISRIFFTNLFIGAGLIAIASMINLGPF